MKVGLGLAPQTTRLGPLRRRSLDLSTAVADADTIGGTALSRRPLPTLMLVRYEKRSARRRYHVAGCFREPWSSGTVSNAHVRGSREYWRDFADPGVALLIDAIDTSLDVGFRKPHPPSSRPPSVLRAAAGARVSWSATQRLTTFSRSACSPRGYRGTTASL
jgi:hypothetical protein